MRPETVAVAFPGYLVSNQKQPFAYSTAIQDYRVETQGVELPDVESDQFMDCVSRLSVTLRCVPGTKSERATMPLLTLEEIVELLDIAETLLRDIQSGRFYILSKTIEQGVTEFEEKTRLCRKNLQRHSTDPDIRTHGLEMMKERLLISSLLVSWGGPMFLKMEGLTLQVASAILELCRQHLKVYS